MPMSEAAFRQRLSDFFHKLATSNSSSVHTEVSSAWLDLTAAAASGEVSSELFLLCAEAAIAAPNPDVARAAVRKFLSLNSDDQALLSRAHGVWSRVLCADSKVIIV